MKPKSKKKERAGLSALLFCARIGAWRIRRIRPIGQIGRMMQICFLSMAGIAI
jgi:hypothetical protein